MIHVLMMQTPPGPRRRTTGLCSTTTSAFHQTTIPTAIIKIQPRLCSFSSMTVRLWSHTGWPPPSIHPPSACSLFKVAGLQSSRVLSPEIQLAGTGVQRTAALVLIQKGLALEETNGSLAVVSAEDRSRPEPWRGKQACLTYGEYRHNIILVQSLLRGKRALRAYKQYSRKVVSIQRWWRGKRARQDENGAARRRLWQRAIPYLKNRAP
jgi:hypothetical protein